MLEAGGALTGFREAFENGPRSPESVSAARRVRAGIAEIFRAPSVASRAGAVDAIDAASARFTSTGETGLNPHLHLMRTALLDPDSPFADGTEAPLIRPLFSHA